MEDFFQRIKRHEGFCKFPKPDNQYKGSAYVIGYGCDITLQEAKTIYSDGISIADAETLLNERLNEIENHLFDTFPWMLQELDEERQNVVAEMAFQMGVQGVRDFPKMLQALRMEDYETAAKEMLNSSWHKQTKARCEELSEIMRTGKAKL